MSRSAAKMKKAIPLRDPKKESLFRGLSETLREAGYFVRREKLKQGHGWKVVSGSCRLKASDLIFVDQRMSQDDQIEFLVSKIASLRVPVPSDRIEIFPKSIVELLKVSPVESPSSAT